LRYGIEWATHVEIEVLMRVLNRSIIVIENNGKVTNPYDAQRFSGEPIFVYYNGHNHYDAFLLKEGFNGRSILQILLSNLSDKADPQQTMTQLRNAQ
jgi:hypothetical protein